MPLHELKAECLVELLGISDREILNILDGKKERTLSSSDSEHEDVFVISDDERRIKKEKKETARKIKTERVSSKKDSVKRKSPEPSISKKKRKSNEEVDVKSKKKKKKSDDKSKSTIPSSSKEVAKVSVSKKKKKEEKNNETPKMKEDDVVVLDDDSDKEEKREQKSLLDLLELEMRARAIRSLLKKEEHSHSQKILSEYKDEPDDLIPIEIEPPQIELLSDSDEDVEIDLNLKEKRCIENSNDDIVSKVAEDLCDFEDQENSSRSPLVSLNNDSNSASCNDLGTQALTSTIEKQGNSENVSKATNEIKGDEDTQSVVHESCKKTSAEEDNSTNVVTVKGDSSCSAVDGMKPTSKQSDESGIVAVKTSSSKDSEIEITTGHFLVYKEPSVVTATDGSQIEENGANSTQPPSICQSFTGDKSDSKDVPDSLAELGQRLSVPETKSFRISARSEISNYNESVEIAAAKPTVPSPVGSANCATVHLGHVSNAPAPSLKNDNAAISSERNVEDDLPLQFEDEALDYDYNPVTSYSEKKSEDFSCQSPSKPSCSADEEILSTGMTSVVNSEQMLSKLGVESNSSHVEKSNSKSHNNPSSPERCLEIQVISVDLDSVSSEPSQKIFSDNPLVDETVTNCVLQDTSKSEYENQPEVICPDDVVVNCDVCSSVVQKSIKPELVLAHSDSGVDKYTPEDKIVPPNEEACSAHVEDVYCGDHEVSKSDNLNLVHADYARDVKSIDGEEKEVHDEEAECPDLLPAQNLVPLTGEGDLVSLSLASKPEVGNESAEHNVLVGKPVSHNMGEAESRQCSPLCDDISGGESDSIAQANGQIPTSPIRDGKKSTSESSSILPFEGVSTGEVSLAIYCESTKSENSLTTNTVVTGLRLGMPNADCRLLDEAVAVETPHDGKNNLSEEKILSSKNVCSGEVSLAINCESTEPENSLNANTSVTGLCPAMPNEDCRIFDGAGTVGTSQPTCPILVPPLSSEVVEIIDEASGTHACDTFVTDHSPSHLKTTEPPQRLIGNGVAEIIDITEGEPVDGPDIVYISEDRFDTECIDDSDSEMSGKTALILEQMNSIFNDDVADGVDSDNSKCSQSSSSGTSEVPAEIISVDSMNSDSDTENETEDEGQFPKSADNVGEVLEIDGDDNNVHSKLSTLNKEPTSHSNDGTSCGGEIIEDSVELVDDSSSSSMCSVESQKVHLKSDDSVMLVHPNSSKYNDCMAATQTECSKNSNGLVVIETDGSESDDCAIVFHPLDTVPDTALSNPEIPEAETSSLVSAAVKESVAVTIVIDDDVVEEARLLTEDVPAEIFELEDDDELKTNWTARWLESDNVKKVVKTSKIWTNVRKQMKMKLKKIDSPVVSDDVIPPEDKGPPPLIGSVEEYHRLVKEGVISSKATQNDDQTCDSNSSVRMNEGGLDTSDRLKSAASQGSESHSESKSIGSKPNKGREKKSERKKSDKKKKSDKSERRKKSRKNCKENSIEVPCCLNASLKPSTKKIDSPRENGTSSLDTKVSEGDVSQEEGEIIEPPIAEVADCVCKKKTESKHNIFDKNSCVEGGKNVGSLEDQEERETSEKEEGEISSDGDDFDNSKSQNICPHEPRYSQNSSTEPKECNRVDSPLSSIPLPHKPPMKSKTQPTKTPERNSAAKRFILRNLQLGRKKPATSKNKKKHKKGGGGGKRASFNLAPKKSQPASLPKVKVPYDTLNLSQMSVAMPNSSLKTTPAIQASYLSAYPGSTQPESNLPLIGPAQNTCTVNNTAQYDSYYSWAYSQGLINSASGNYGYGTPEATPDPNIYKQWEEYYRKLMEACKISAAHATAGTLVGSTEAEKGYTWVFDHSATAPQSAPVQAPADSTADAGSQAQAVDTLPEQSAVDPSPVPINEMTVKDRFESWQFRYGLKGLLKECFIPAPNPGGNEQT